MDKWLDPSTPPDSALQCLTDPSNLRHLVSASFSFSLFSSFKQYLTNKKQWHPVTRSVGNVNYDQRDCIEDIKSVKLPSSSTAANSTVTQFFKPVDKSSPSSSPTRSHYFSPNSSPQKGSPQPPRDFDKEVGEFPTELLDVSDDDLIAQCTQTSTTLTANTNKNANTNNATVNNNVHTSNSANNLLSPAQTVPHTPSQPAPQIVPSPPLPQKEKEEGQEATTQQNTLPSTPLHEGIPKDEPSTPSQPSRASSSYPNNKGIKSKRKLDFEPVSDPKKQRS